MMTVLLAAASAASASAQGLHESIGVDGKYVREVIVQDKIFTLPSRLSFTLESQPPAWYSEGVPTLFRPTAIPMPTVTPFAERIPDNSRGYIDLGLGSWLDGNLSAGYRFLDSQSTKAGAFVQFNSTALCRPDLSEESRGVRRRLADGRIGLYASHRFGAKGTLSASADYRLAGFNYYGYARLGAFFPSADPDAAVHAPTQTLNEVNARIGWKSSTGYGGPDYDALAGIRYFGYRALYLPDENLDMLRQTKGDRETDIYIDGGISHQWRSGSELGLRLKGDILLYSDSRKDLPAIPAPDNYGMVSLNPYYRFSRGLLNIRVGATVDLAFNAGPERDRFNTFHIAPDVRLDWRKGAVGLFLNLLGGSSLQTLASLEGTDYYQMPALSSTRPLYSPLDAAAGANFGPFAGFSAGLSFRYRISRRVPAGGWYAAMLNWGNTAFPGMNVPLDADPYAVGYSLSDEGIDISGFGLEAHASYRLGSILDLSAEGTWQPQNSTRGYFNGYDRPRWTAAITATVRPVSKLSLSLQYEYRGVRRIYTQAARLATVPDQTQGIPVIDDTDRDLPILSRRLPDLTLLNARAAWQFSPRLGIFVQAANLLDRRDEILPLLPQNGISITGGVNFLF